MDDGQGHAGRWALITGASAGIGEAFARLLGGHGCSLILTSRRTERLESLAAGIRESHGVEVQCHSCDLGQPDGVESLISSIDVDVDILINSAGYAIPDYFIDSDWDSIRRFLEVMAMAPIHLAHAYMPGMVDRGWGRVIHVSSLAGFVPESPGSLYGPSKSFMVSYARSQARELKGSGVHITALCPGFTRTEFHDVLGNREEVDRMPRWMWSEVDPVVRAGWSAVEKGREVCIPGLVNKGIQAMFALMPSAIQRKLPYTRMPGRHEISDSEPERHG